MPPSMTHRRRAFWKKLRDLALAIAIASAGAAWILSGSGAEQPTNEEAAPASAPLRVAVFESRAQDLEYAFPIRGYTEASRRVDVRAETGGLTVSERVPKGTNVFEGQTLCRIEDGNRPALLTQAEARVRQTRTEATSARSLSEKGFTPETAAAAADAALATAIAELDRVKLDLRRTSILAPFDGSLEEGGVEPGTLLQPGALCATILDLDPMLIVGFAPERAIGAFQLGTEAGAILASGAEVTGRISFVARSAESRTRTFRIEVTIPNPDGAFREGVSAEILIPIRHSDAHLIPQSALTLSSEGILGVRIVDNQSTARFMPVTLLRDAKDGMWVSGLAPLTRIIVIGQEFVSDGVPVAAVPAPVLATQ